MLLLAAEALGRSNKQRRQGKRRRVLAADDAGLLLLSGEHLSARGNQQRGGCAAAATLTGLRQALAAVSALCSTRTRRAAAGARSPQNSAE